MSTRPLPAHGTYSRGNGSPGRRPACHCDPCRAAVHRGKKRARINHARGITGRVDATPARNHLQLLHQTMGWSEIQQATGCAMDTLINTAKARRQQISRHTSQRILAVQPRARMTGGLYINATGTRRRLQAMQAIGHSQQTIADTIDGSAENVRKVINGQPCVRAAYADKIRAAYSVLATTPGASAAARRRAERNQWPDPTYWEDTDAIDDPDHDPHTPTPARLRIEDVAEDAAWLQQAGHTPDQIADRLGVSRAYIHKALAHARTEERTAA